MKLQAKPSFDEFAFILLAALIFIGMMVIYYSTPTETPPTFQPKSISISIVPGNSKNVIFEVYGNISSLQLSSNGTIANWVTFSENSFPVFGEKESKFTISAPKNIPYGDYFGYIIGKTSGGEDYIEVKVRVIPYYSLVGKTFSIFDFSLENYGKAILEIGKDFVIEKSLFSEREKKTVFQVSGEVEKAYVKLLVYGREGNGYLTIKLNGETIFRQILSEGEKYIPINTSYLTENNVLTLKVESEGLNSLFKSSYTILSAYVVIEYKGKNSYSYEFNLSPSERENFHSIEFSSATKPSENNLTLEVRFNDQIVFLGKITSPFRATFVKDLLGNELLSKEKNVLKFILMDEGKVTFENNIIKINFMS